MENYIKIFIKPHETKYIRNMQSHIGKANIHYEVETTNEYDNEAILLYTYNRKKEKIYLGYIQKKEFISYEYTEEAKELYYKYKAILHENCGNFDDKRIRALKCDENWGKTTGKKYYEYLHTDEELEQIKKDIENDYYNFLYDINEECGFLIINKSGLENE